MRTLIALLCCSVLAVGQNSNLGSSGAKFLSIPVGARAAGMGGAVIGTADDASAVFWNPAGIARLTGTALHFSSLDLYGQFGMSAASVVQNLGDAGTIAASYTSLTMKKTEITTELQPEGTGRFFDAQDIAIGLTYSRALSTEFSAGLTVKYVNQRIWNEVAEGVAFDFGTQYKVNFQNLVIAMSMSNFGGDIRFDGEDLNITYLQNKDYPVSRLAPGRLQTSGVPLPLIFQVGVAMDLERNELFSIRGEIDATHPNDADERVNVGTEIGFLDRLYLRSGYRFNYDDEGFTLGGGFTAQIGESIVRFDYAYAQFDLLPNLHRYSVGLEF